ncbi:MAG: NfeD family protein [Bacteroidales bacterium]|nr:NfeD family protein [Bacteroidales bacterium]
MTEWWTSLDLFMKILWCIAIASSLIFIIETVLTFIGADVEMDMDTDFDMPDGGFEGDPSMNLYTFRNLVNFLLGMSWTAILLQEQIASKALLMVIAFAVGTLLVFAVMMMFKGLSKMQQSGNIDLYKSAVGCNGKVYLTVPAERKGSGKVQISINDSIREYDALTDSEDDLKTGTSIKVVEVLDASTLLVEEINSLII